MILFPHCKINLGLHVTARREDGFHEIETVFHPVRGLCDAVEILAVDDADNSLEPDVTFSSTGLVVDCTDDNNLCVKAYRILKEAFPERVGAVKIHLHKTIPFGAGLGGGSADATAVLRGVNDLFDLGLSVADLEPFAARLGSDTVFFLHNCSMLGTGRGEQLQPLPSFSLSGWWLLLVKPNVGVSTAEAYSLITARQPNQSLESVLCRPLDDWRASLVNDFERPLFERLPLLGQIKEELYTHGADYVSMSGSGSTLFGLFKNEPNSGWAAKYFTHKERL